MAEWFERFSRPRRRTVDKALLPSMNFLLVCLLFAGTGALLWHGVIHGPGAVIVFVVSGSIVALCLHEFGHAFVAYKGGDWTVAQTGYLDLDPLKYTDPLLSIVLPLVYILIGGFALPGGAVWINHSLLRSAVWDSAVSVAGPAADLGFFLLLAVIYHLLPDEAGDIAPAVGVLAYFEATAIVLNLLPLPGLDGFGIIRPWLPPHVAEAGNVIAAGFGFVLVLLVLSSAQVGEVVFGVGSWLCHLVGVYDIGAGWNMLNFWRTGA